MITRIYSVDTSQALSFGGAAAQRYLVVEHEMETDGCLVRYQDYYSFSDREKLIQRLCDSIILNVRRSAAVPLLFAPGIKDTELGESYLNCVRIVGEYLAKKKSCPLYSRKDELPSELINEITEMSLALADEEEFARTIAQTRIRGMIKDIIQAHDELDYEKDI